MNYLLRRTCLSGSGTMAGEVRRSGAGLALLLVVVVLLLGLASRRVPPTGNHLVCRQYQGSLEQIAPASPVSG